MLKSGSENQHLSPKWAAEAQVLGSSPTTFPGTLAGNLMENGAAGIQTGTSAQNAKLASGG